MSDRRFISPMRDLRVPDHELGGYLPKDGREVLWDMRWQRHLNDASIEVGETAKKPKSKPLRVPVGEES